MQNSQAPAGIRMERKSFLLSVFFIFLMMVAAYILTLVIPGGSYTRVPDADGNLIIDVSAGFHAGPGGLPFWKWLLSPILVLGASGSATLIAVILFLLLIGGVFNVVNEQGIIVDRGDTIHHWCWVDQLWENFSETDVIGALWGENKSKKMIKASESHAEGVSE